MACKRYSEENLAVAIEMVRGGATLRAAAAILGVTHERTRQLCKRHGVVSIRTWKMAHLTDAERALVNA